MGLVLGSDTSYGIDTGIGHFLWYWYWNQTLLMVVVPGSDTSYGIDTGIRHIWYWYRNRPKERIGVRQDEGAYTLLYQSFLSSEDTPSSSVTTSHLKMV